MADPYVKVNLIQQGQRISKWKTSTKKGTVNPIFYEMCEVDVSGMEIEDVQLDIVVMDYDRLGHNNEIGCVMFGDLVSHMSGLSHWKKVMIETNTEVCQWHPLVPRQSLSRSSSPQRYGSRSSLAMRGCFRVSPSGLQL